MGERVDAAANEVKEVAGVESIFCPICGDEDGDNFAGIPTGNAPVVYAEANWIEQEGSLYCNIEHAALGAGLDAATAQLAKAEAARLLLRREGHDDIADADKAYVTDIVENPEKYPYSPSLDQVADEDTHERETPEEEITNVWGEDADEMSEILEALKRGDD